MGPRSRNERFPGVSFLSNTPSFPKGALNELVEFMEKADLVKFAGVTATPETADEATQSARDYIRKDNEEIGRL